MFQKLTQNQPKLKVRLKKNNQELIDQEKKFNSIIEKNKSQITDLESQIAFYKEGIDLMIQEKKDTKELEAMNLSIMNDMSSNIESFEKRIKRKNVQLKTLKEDLENYKFFFVLMYLTGVVSIKDSTDITKNKALINKPSKEILSELDKLKKSLVKERDEVYGLSKS